MESNKNVKVTTFALCIYCVSGTLLTLFNKLAILAFPAPNSLLLFQNGATVLLLLLVTHITPDRFGGSLPLITFSVVRSWLPLTLLFVGMLGSSLLALQNVSSVTLIVFRNLCTLVVAFFERLFLGLEINSLAAISLVGILCGAFLYALNDIQFSVIGYIWLIVNVICTAIFQIYVKSLIANLPNEGPGSLGPFGMSYFNNVISLPVFGMLAAITGEFTHLQELIYTLSIKSWSIIVSSALLGFTLSTSAFLVTKLVSATSMMVANNVNKFALIILSEVFVEQTLVPLSSLGTALVMIFAWLYSQSKGSLTKLFNKTCVKNLLVFVFIILFLDLDFFWPVKLLKLQPLVAIEETRLSSYKQFIRSALEGNVDWGSSYSCYTCNCSNIWQSIVVDNDGRFCTDVLTSVTELLRVTKVLPYRYCLGGSCPIIPNTGNKLNSYSTILTERPHTVFQSQKNNRINIFVADYHTGLVRDLKHFFTTWLKDRLGAVDIVFNDQSLSAYCLLQTPPTCIRSDEIAFLRRDNAWPECPSQASFQSNFWESLKSDKTLQSTDIFLCTLPIWGCMRYIPFNRSFILIDAVDLGAKPQTLNTLMALQNMNFNKMTLAYNYAVGIHKKWHPIYLPSYSGFSGSMQLEKILARNKNNEVNIFVHVKGGSRQSFVNVDLNLNELETILNDLEQQKYSMQPRTFKVLNLMVATPNFNLSVLTDPFSEFPASILVSTSFQTVFMSGYEMYRTNIPLFFPFRQLDEKGDFTYYPGIQYYASVEDLASKIISTDLTYYNTITELHNQLLGQALAEVWAWRFNEMLPGLLNGTYVRPSYNESMSIDEAWFAATGLSWSPSQEIVSCGAPDEIFTKSPHTP
jgi:GDP-mannose transporter